MGVVVWLACRYADWVSALLGPSGSRVVTRLSAFLLLCIGVQIMVTGVTEIVTPLLGARE
jgi:multiple antibiotic resistance protein